MTVIDNGWAALESAFERASPEHRHTVTSALLAQSLRNIALAPAFREHRDVLAQTGPANAIRVLHGLDIQTREDLSTRLDEYQIPQPSPTKSVFTSGSSGRSLAIQRAPIEQQVELDFVQYAWKRMGVPDDAKGAALTGRTLSSGDHLLDRNGFLWISCTRLGNETWSRVTELLRSYQRDYVRGYGSLVGRYFSAVHQSEVPDAKIRSVAYSSDLMLPEHRASIAAVTGAAPIGLYGSVERALMAVSCEASDLYHVFDTYGYAEILDQTGKPISDSNTVGTLAGTSLWPRATAIARYRIGDSASWVSGACECGRTQRRFRLVAGRERDVLVDVNGTSRILGPEIYEPIFQALPSGYDLQFAQPHPGRLIIRIPHSTEGLRERIGQLANMHLSNLLEVNVVDEETIRTEAGKRLLLDRSI